MARRRRPLNLFDKIFLGLVLLAVLMVPVLKIVSNVKQEKETAYHEKFQSVIESYIADGSLVTGNKAVCLNAGSNQDGKVTYTAAHVPKRYFAKEPEEVRYLIRYVHGSTIIGYYSGGGIGTQPWVELEVQDLKTGEIMGQETFMGGMPPQSISAHAGEYVSRSGAAPSEEKIMQWIQDVLEGKNPEASEGTTETQPEETSVPDTSQEASAPTEQENAAGNDKALELALNWLEEGRGYSPTTLKEALIEYDGCTEKEAAYAVANCNADWKEQALIAAKSNLDMDDYGFGPVSLEEALQYDGFTAEQIAYAMENCNADWKEQALKLAIFHSDSTGWSYSNMYLSLMSVYGFSEEEAKYGADNCNADWFKAAADHVAIFLEYSETEYTREAMIEEMVEYYGFTEEQAIYGVDQNGMK